MYMYTEYTGNVINSNLTNHCKRPSRTGLQSRSLLKPKTSYRITILTFKLECNEIIRFRLCFGVCKMNRIALTLTMIKLPVALTHMTFRKLRYITT